MEFALMDTLIYHCRQRGVMEVRGYYYPTAKNGMVKDFYALQGFEKVSEDESGNTVWKFEINDDYIAKNNVIDVEK
jgi:predicted enzyme involved in methoxymalonyl-ACP biosynthesis